MQNASTTLLFLGRREGKPPETKYHFFASCPTWPPVFFIRIVHVFAGLYGNSEESALNIEVFNKGCKILINLVLYYCCGRMQNRTALQPSPTIS
jgi:hypothetical protein